jgi:hypothetical protein
MQGGEEPLPEALLWLLLTGECPTQNQTQVCRYAVAQNIYA